MTQASPSTPAARARRRETPAHLFAVGQTVRLKGGFGRIAQATDIYQITATLPPRGTALQYRIRSGEERHERVATQDSLEIVDTSAATDDATLLERTFPHGQGTDAQFARDQEAEEGQGAGEA
jgi:hypothetical protein